MQRLTILIISIIMFIGAVQVFGKAAPAEINYQATLLETDGDPVTTETEVKFTVYDDAVAGTVLWAETLMVTPDANGVFSQILGQANNITDGVFAGENRWLGITIGTDAEITPRSKLVSQPYSLRVNTIDQATAGDLEGMLNIIPTEGGPGDDAGLYVQNSVAENAFSMTVSADQPIFIVKGPGGDEQTEFTSSGMNIYEDDAGRALQKLIAINQKGIIIHGDTEADTLAILEGSTGQLSVTNKIEVNWPVAKYGRGDGAVETGLGSSSFGPNNLSLADYSLAVGSGNVGNNVTSVFMVGNDNLIDDDLGDPNVWGDGSVAIGDTNIVKGNSSFCVGTNNWLGANRSTVFGRNNNTTGSGQVFVFGDSCQTSNTGNASITGGYNNIIESGSNGVISGGLGNYIDNTLYANIAGGLENHVDGDLTFNGGTIGGGASNSVAGGWATIAGGYSNESNGSQSTVGGGNSNRALGIQATVSGGYNNYARGDYSTVPGGSNNHADSNYTFASGRDAWSLHRGTYVWADDQGGLVFQSTDTNQYLIRASGGVGINTNSPTQALEVAGTIYSTSGGFKFPDGTVQSSAAASVTDGWTDGGNYMYPTNNSDSLGIGTTTPKEKLDVIGNIHTSGTFSLGGTSKAWDDPPFRVSEDELFFGAGWTTGDKSGLQVFGDSALFLGTGWKTADKRGFSFVAFDTIFPDFEIMGHEDKKLQLGIDINGPHFQYVDNNGDTTMQMTEDGLTLGHWPSVARLQTTAHGVFLIDNTTGDTTAQYTGDGFKAINSPDGGLSFDTVLIDTFGMTISNGSQILKYGNNGVVFDNEWDTTISISLDGDIRTIGKITLAEGNYKDNSKAGVNRIEIDPDAGSGEGGTITFFRDDGAEGLKLIGESDGDGGALIYCMDLENDTTVRIDGNDGGKGGRLSLRKGDGTTTVLLRSDVGGSNGGGRLNLYGPNGETRATLEADEGDDGGAQLILTNNNGDTTIQIDADINGTGEGRVITQVLEVSGADLSEHFDVASYSKIDPKAGLVVSIDPNSIGQLQISSKAYDPCVAGVISGAGGVRVGLLMGQQGTIGDGDYPIALTGRVYCWADANNGEIKPGDLLTTSNIPGHAMKVTDHNKAYGAVIGKAMTSLNEGRGLVLVLVTLQ